MWLENYVYILSDICHQSQPDFAAYSKSLFVFVVQG